MKAAPLKHCATWRNAMMWLVFGVLLFIASPAIAQSVSIDLGAAGQNGATGRLIQLTALITVLSIAPSLLVMVTAFTRIVIVLSLLRSAIGAQGVPPNTVLIGLALFLTFFVMQPVLDQSYTNGLLPMSDGRVGELEGLRLAAEPFRHFMAVNVRGATTCSFSWTSPTCPQPPTQTAPHGAPWSPPS